jgi:para-aminobenzoate synthetase component 1
VRLDELGAWVPAGEPFAIVRVAGVYVLATQAEDMVRVRARDAIDHLDRLRSGWWAGFVSFECGHGIERVVDHRRDDPEVIFVRFGRRQRLVAPRRRQLAKSAGTGTWSSSLERDRFESGVEAIQALIRDGECYQVNLTRQLSSMVRANPTFLFLQLAQHNPARHAALMCVGGVAVVSASPERFLAWRGRSVETRPIKGTGRDARALACSAKDRAENVMIVDLARNDLGRVCEPGSIHVPGLCVVEQYPGLVHLVSTVRGRLRPGVGLRSLLAATFPPASVTGAPKPRVLQAIADLEPVPRGAYCGAIGWIDVEHRRGDLAVAIRTFTITPAGTTLGIGAGITIDSDPAHEWCETELKARNLVAVAEAVMR